MFGGDSLKSMMINCDLAWNQYCETVGAKEAYMECLSILLV